MVLLVVTIRVVKVASPSELSQIMQMRKINIDYPIHAQVQVTVIFESFRVERGYVYSECRQVKQETSTPLASDSKSVSCQCVDWGT